MFIKVFDVKKYAVDFYEKGVMKFSTSTYFNSLDDKERGDTTEGRIIIDKMLKNLQTIGMEDYKISYGGHIDGYTYSIALIDNFNDIVTNNLLEFGNGNKEACAIVIKNPIKFLDRFKSVNDITNFYFGKINYVSVTRHFKRNNLLRLK